MSGAQLLGQLSCLLIVAVLVAAAFVNGVLGWADRAADRDRPASDDGDGFDVDQWEDRRR